MSDIPIHLELFGPPSSDAVTASTRAQLAHETLAIVLADGRGARLGPLTYARAKPLLPFGGTSRIIDFALSNCLNSGVRRIGIATQYHAQGVIRHVRRAWSFPHGRRTELIELLPAQQRVTAEWYRGTADAVYQNLDFLRRCNRRFVIVLAGEHVYKMNFGDILDAHSRKRAEATVACVEVDVDDARQLGVIEVDADDRVTRFEERPDAPPPIPEQPARALGSMGIYVFDTDFLCEQLVRDAGDYDSSHDFGRDLMPRLVAEGARVYAHRCAGSAPDREGRPYWRDLRTIDAYWEANMELLDLNPALDLYDPSWPIWTCEERLPPVKLVFEDGGRHGVATDSILSGGCVVGGSEVKRSVLYPGVRVHGGCDLEDAVILPHVEIGPRARLRRVVVDKRTRIPPSLVVGIDIEADRKRFYVTPNGITLITAAMLDDRQGSNEMPVRNTEGRALASTGQ